MQNFKQLGRLVKSYKRIELPPIINHGRVDEFIIESLAKPQWRKIEGSNPYTLTPFTYFKGSSEEYDYWGELQKISYCSSFFMKPFNIMAYGSDHKAINQDTLMVRGWLHEDDTNKLNILILMEKLNKIKLYDSYDRYYYILNNPHWYPSLEFYKNRINKKDDNITQDINYETDKYTIY